MSRKYRPEEKLRVVLEAVRGDSSLSRICEKYQIDLKILNNWIIRYPKIRKEAKTRLGKDFDKCIS